MSGYLQASYRSILVQFLKKKKNTINFNFHDKHIFIKIQPNMSEQEWNGKESMICLTPKSHPKFLCPKQKSFHWKRVF